MKKLFLLLGVFSFSVKVNAQNLEEIGEMIDKSQYTQARTAVEKFLSNPKKVNDAEAWFLKGVVYNAISKDATASADSSLKWKEESYQAFLRNQQLDPKDIRLSFQQHIPYLDLYFEFMNLGVKYFNLKNFEGALASFKKANEVKDYIVSKKYEYEQAKLYPLDTSLVRNIAITAFQAKKEEEGIVYLNKLIDANVSGEEFFDVYSTVAEYHLKKNDLTSLNALVEKGRKYYPTNNYWYELEIRSIGENPSKEQLYKKYEELIAKSPDNFYLCYNYGVELFKNDKNKDFLNDSDISQINKTTSILKKASDLEDKSDVTSAILLANHLYKYAYSLQNTSNQKKLKPEEKKLMKNGVNAIIDECLKYCQKVDIFYSNIKPEGIVILKDSNKVIYKMKSENGISKLPCKVNGITMDFIMDTGASDVSLSLTEAKFMLKNGYLDASDFLGKTNFIDANGDINQGLKINLKKFEFAGIILENVEATIINSNKADLLLGQSALKRSGEIAFNFNDNTLIINSKNAYKSFTLTDIQKANHKIILGFMKEIYETRGDLNKAKEIDKKIADISFL